MSDIVKASIIIGIAIFLSQGFYYATPAGNALSVTNKFTGTTSVCYQGKCTEFKNVQPK